MQRSHFSSRFFSFPDLLILLLVGTTIYGVVSIANEWRADFHPVTQINLSIWALPRYTLLSGIRGTVAYLISLAFTLVVGYAAAKSKSAERVIIPMLDILQSIPVLGFLPGVVLALVALFPRTNTGLELTAIIMIFTGQVWNMTFSYYASLKSIPSDFEEAATIMGLSRRQKLMSVELPFSAVNLAWNSLLSMAGGWFFLSVCEAGPLGDHEYRLPGVGSYMAVAVSEGNTQAMFMGVAAMVGLIVGMDFFIWRPILAWVRRFRLENVPGVEAEEPLMQVVIRESRVLRLIKLLYRETPFSRHGRLRPNRARKILEGGLTLVKKTVPWPKLVTPEASVEMGAFHSLPARSVRRLYLIQRLFNEARKSRFLVRFFEYAPWVLVITGLVWGFAKLTGVLVQVTWPTWVILFRNTFWTTVRVFATLAISTLWAVPAGIWIGTSQKRTRIAQPIIQVLASFPAPMLYPLALAVFFYFHISFDWGSMFLMLLGVQWYVLFNVLAGALRISQELKYALALMETPRLERWTTLYLPSVFPALVTGWVTAAGGAWNASIVAEYISYHGQKLRTEGLGSLITEATEKQDFTLLAASLTVMVVVVVLLNRTLWHRVYHLAQNRFRMD